MTALLTAVPAMTAVAADTQPVAGGTALGPAHPVLTFSGTFTNPTPLPAVSDPDPTICASGCQQWRLSVDTRDPFLVSIKNSTGSMDDGLNLYVDDPSGQQVGSSAGVGSNGQAVAVTPSVTGDYRIVVTETYQYDQEVTYLGEARIMSEPSWNVVHCSKPCPLLPQLEPSPPTAFHVDGIPPVASTPLGFPFPFDIPTGNSCYVDETAGTGATRCLRFTSAVGNVGAGVLHLRVQWLSTDGGTPQSAFLPGECQATEIVQWSDGSTTTAPAGPCEFHAEHGHFHYDNFVSFGLYQVNPDGSTGALVGRSLKESFCLADDGYFGFGTPGPNGPRGYAGQPDCNVPSGSDASSPAIDMGVSPGWADVYTWDTPSQYIDISTVPPGVYDVIAETNPSGDLTLAGPAHVCSRSRIELTSTSVQEVGSASDIACP